MELSSVSVSVSGSCAESGGLGFRERERVDDEEEGDKVAAVQSLV